MLVDDLELDDIDILDITNPSKPKKVSETNLQEFAQTGPRRPHGDAVFSHDMVVKRIGGRDIMLMSYWDGGYVMLDVTDPANPDPLSDTDFAAERPGPQGARPDRSRPRATPTRRSSRATTSSSSPPTRTSTPIASRPRSRAARPPARCSPRSRARPPSRSTRTTRWPVTREFLGLGCDPMRGGRRSRPDRRRRARRVRLPGQAGQHRGGGLRRPDRVQPHRRGRLRDARQHARRVGRRRRRCSSRARTASACSASSPPADYTCRRTDGSGTPTPAGPVGAGRHLRRLRRLGLHAHVPDRT